MNWEKKPMTRGDIVRVQVGAIWHYGICVDADAIVQFGPNPSRWTETRDEEIVVCMSNVRDFCAGAAWEVGVPTAEEASCKRTVEEIVHAATERIGERGYNVIHNNCEHFAYECYLGKRRSEQEEQMRAKLRALLAERAPK